MNSINFKFNFLNLGLLQKNKNNGFTLIELLVVIIIIGVLAAVALPSMLTQVGKARETEATSNLGAMARSQNAYHFEHQTFAATLNELALNGSFSSKYYTFSDPTTVSDTIVKHQANSRDSNQDRVREYALGVYFSGGAVANMICRGADVGQVVEAGATPGDSCTNGGTIIQ